MPFRLNMTNNLIKGRMNVYNQPIVEVDIKRGNGEFASFELKLDTGFNGDITIAPTGIPEDQLTNNKIPVHPSNPGNPRF